MAKLGEDIPPVLTAKLREKGQAIYARLCADGKIPTAKSLGIRESDYVAARDRYARHPLHACGEFLRDMNTDSREMLDSWSRAIEFASDPINLLPASWPRLAQRKRVIEADIALDSATYYVATGSNTAKASVQHGLRAMTQLHDEVGPELCALAVKLGLDIDEVFA